MGINDQSVAVHDFREEVRCNFVVQYLTPTYYITYGMGIRQAGLDNGLCGRCVTMIRFGPLYAGSGDMRWSLPLT